MRVWIYMFVCVCVVRQEGVLLGGAEGTERMGCRINSAYPSSLPLPRVLLRAARYTSELRRRVAYRICCPGHKLTLRIRSCSIACSSHFHHNDAVAFRWGQCLGEALAAPDVVPSPSNCRCTDNSTDGATDYRNADTAIFATAAITTATGSLARRAACT
jgi:hypothetical protein